MREPESDFSSSGSESPPPPPPPPKAEPHARVSTSAPHHAPHAPHEHAPPPTRRQSIANRLLGSFNQVRKDTKEKVKNEPPPPAAASAKRRSSVAEKSSPMTRIRSWLDTCNAQHSHHCSGDDPDAETWRPVYLVDSVERCLVKAKPTDRYLALSYVWAPLNQRRGGPTTVVQLLKSNIEAFQSDLPEVDLPETILDAMYMARKLGFRYLWVDQLCIVQDDEVDKENHVRHMPYIFANAYLTIAAAYGDLYTGLLPISPRRHQRESKAGNSSGSTKDHSELLRQSKWNNRGWTLQELLYSRRIVFFFQDTVTWECHCNLWQKNSINIMPKLRASSRHDCANRLSSAILGYKHPPWPDLDEYARIAADYSARRVTYVEDTLRAFSGITSMLSRTFSDGFMYGMPLMFLDIALLWRPQASIRRRAPPRAPFFPSWSWMGWWFDGVPVDLILWKAAADYVEETSPVKIGSNSKRLQTMQTFRIKPTVTWHLTDRATTVPVANNGLRYRDLRSRKNAGTPLPRGWSRSGSSFKHDSDRTTIFKYPVPVTDPPKDGPHAPTPAEQTFPGPLLSFRTAAGFFDVDLADTMAPKDGSNPQIAIGNIWGRSGKWIGEFRAHDAWMGVQTSNYEGGEKLEFIAISTGMERKGSFIFPPERFEENKDADGILDFVNVLWIERIGTVCYRRGIGHILLKAWNAQVRDQVDILLG
ncbi:tol protein [Trichoderma gracile]